MVRALVLIMNLSNEIRVDLLNGRDVSKKVLLLNKWLKEYQQQYELTLLLK